MISKLLLCLLTVSALFAPETVTLHPLSLASASGDVRAESIGSESSAYATYTVWYRVPGKRWTGISGLSYQSACRIRDDYLNKGYSAYVERE